MNYYENKLAECGLTFSDIFMATNCGFYYKENNEIYYMRNAVNVGFSFVEVKPCYAIKETTLKSCYYGDVEPIKEVQDAHYWSWKTSRNWRFEDYGKTWALTKEVLNNE